MKGSNSKKSIRNVTLLKLILDKENGTMRVFFSKATLLNLFKCGHDCEFFKVNCVIFDRNVQYV